LLSPHTLWMRCNGAGADVMQRVMLSSRALEVAQVLETAQLPAFTPDMVITLFAENLRLDFRSETARAIYQHCLNRLVATRWF
jgi:hypothetical protein